ncbi:MAG: sugar phosphate isomerase/epimerase [Gemmatimonadota bacterium]|nr:sugar phosphate isomerase/epimerase [Gemmatimonadota bacterium]
MTREPAHPLSRRDFLARTGAGGAAIASGVLLNGALPTLAGASEIGAAAAQAPRKVPIGLELYSVRGELAKDLPNTLRNVAQMGYEVVEFYAPYLAWTFPYAKNVRTQLDDLGLRCNSTHNSAAAVTPGDTMMRAIELNQILGARHIILASPPGNTKSLDDWKRFSGVLSSTVEQLKPHGLLTGFHNHLIEWSPLEGRQRVMDVLAANTPPEFVLQLDVGTCLEAGVDPIAWMKSNPGRIRSLHLKDWAPGAEADQKGYRVLFGEGIGPWNEVFATAESVGGVEFYLMEQEGSRYSELETARRCLDNYRNMRKSG